MARATTVLQLCTGSRSPAGRAGGSAGAARTTVVVSDVEAAADTVRTLRHSPLFHEPSRSDTKESADGIPRMRRQQGSIAAEPSVHQMVSGLYSTSSARDSIAPNADMTEPELPVGTCHATSRPWLA